MGSTSIRGIRRAASQRGGHQFALFTSRLRAISGLQGKPEFLSGYKERPQVSEGELPLWRRPLDVLLRKIGRWLLAHEGRNMVYIGSELVLRAALF